MLNFFRTLSIRERRIVFGVIVGAVLLTSVPYLFGMFRQGRDYRYLNTNPIASADTNVYFSFMKQAAQGDVFVRNLHTSEPQVGSIFHPLWLVLGWVSGLLSLSIPLVFHLARIVLAVVFLLVLYDLLCQLFDRSRRRMIAFVLLAFSSGIGTIFSLDVSLREPMQIMLLLPTDHWVSESNTFLTLFHSPLFVLSQLLIVVILRQFLYEERWRSFLLPAGLLFFLGLVHPYDLVTLGVLLPALLIVRLLRDSSFKRQDAQRYLKRLVFAGALAVPALIYFFAVTATQTAVGSWAKQNVTTSPPIHSYLIGYGFVFGFAVVGFVALWRTRHRAQLLVMTWAVVSALLLYMPIQINRRMSNGLHIPLAILAAVGIDLLWGWLARHLPERRPMLRAGVFAAVGWVMGLGLFFSTVSIVLKSMYWSANPKTSIYYISTDQANAIDWLGTHAARNDVILSQSFIGNVIPARTGLRVFAGHGHQTIDWEKKIANVSGWFYKTDDDPAKEMFLGKNGISYVFFSPIEDDLGDYKPETKPYLVRVYQNATTSVYRVRL